MNFRILYKGNDISGDCLSYERNHVLCDGIGTLRMSTTLNAYTFEPYEVITIEEDGHTKGKYYIVSIDGLVPENITQVTAQDASKRLSDYFVWEVTESGDAPTYTKDWIEKYLGEAGVSYAFDVSGSGTIVSNNMSFGRQSAMEIITELLKQSGWYLHTDSGGTVRIGKITIDMTNPAGYFDDTDIIRIDTAANDTSLRNQVTVWGNGNPVTGDYVFAKLYTPTPWDRDALDIRKVGINVAGVREDSTAAGIASQILKETTKLTYIKTVDLTGFRNIHIGDTAFIESDYFTGGGIVTTISCKVNGGSGGAVTTLTLDERCERMVGYYDFGDYVYVGTNGGGIWRKHIRYDHTWEDYSQGLSNLVIPDLSINEGVFACVDGLGNLYTRYSSEAAWVKFSSTNRFVDETGTLYSIADVSCVACTINRYTNHVMAVFNLTGQVSPFVSMGVTYYQVVGSPRSWVVDMTSRNTYTVTMITVDVLGATQYGVYGLDCDHNEKNLYLAVMHSYPGGNWESPNYANTSTEIQNHLDPVVGYEYILPVVTNPLARYDFGIGHAGFNTHVFSHQSIYDYATGVGSLLVDSIGALSGYDITPVDDTSMMACAPWSGSIYLEMDIYKISGSEGAEFITRDMPATITDDEGTWNCGWPPVLGGVWLDIISHDDVGTVITPCLLWRQTGALTYQIKYAIMGRDMDPSTVTVGDWYVIAHDSAITVGPASFYSTAHMSKLILTDYGVFGRIRIDSSTTNKFFLYDFASGIPTDFVTAPSIYWPEVSGGLVYNVMPAYCKENHTVYLCAKSTAFSTPNRRVEISVPALTYNVVVATFDSYNAFTTSNISAVQNNGDGTKTSLYNSADYDPSPRILDMGANGDDVDGGFIAAVYSGGSLVGNSKFSMDFSQEYPVSMSGTPGLVDGLPYPSLYGNTIVTSLRLMGGDTGAAYKPTGALTPVPPGWGLSYLYGVIRPVVDDDYENVYYPGLEPRIDCSQSAPIVVWGDGPAHGWMYISDTGNFNDYHLVDPGYVTGFLYFGPRVYHETTYSGGIDGGHYYGRILYPHANAVWNYDTENETQYGSHYTDDPQEGEYYDFSHEVKAVETTNYLDKPYFFVACSGTGAGPYFYQKDGNNLGETESFTWDDHSAGLPTEEILTIRIDDRN
jgi:hypothetical protein